MAPERPHRKGRDDGRRSKNSNGVLGKPEFVILSSTLDGEDIKLPTETTSVRDRLNAWIKTSPHSKGDFADMIQVNPASLSRILNGDTKKPDATTLKAIEDVTGGAIVMQDWVE